LWGSPVATTADTYESLNVYEKIQQQHLFNGPLSGTTWVSRNQKGKTNLDFTAVSGSGISWAICKSAPRSREITTPAPHHSEFFTDQMPFLSPNQQHQSTEDK